MYIIERDARRHRRLWQIRQCDDGAAAAAAAAATRKIGNWLAAVRQYIAIDQKGGTERYG